MEIKNSKNWLVGAAEVDITPTASVFLYGYPHVPRMSTCVNDPLLASAIAFSDGLGTAVFVSCDVIWVPRDVCAAARQRLEDVTSVPAEHIMVTATHTHSGPVTAQIVSNLNDHVVPPPDQAYLKRLEDAIVEAGQSAIQAMRPANLLHAIADGSQLGTNRHEPQGPSIPQVPVLLARDTATQEPIAVMCVCSMHPTVLHEDSTCISGDFPGLARRRLRHRYDLNFPVIYHMGAAGNQSPRHVVRQNTQEEADRLGRILADAIIAALGSAKPLEPVSLDVVSQRIDHLPLRRFPGTDQAELELCNARERLERLRHWHAEPAQIRSAEVDCFGAEETLTLAKLMAQDRLGSIAQSCLPVEVQVVRLGEFAFVGWPGEVFAEFAIELMRRHDHLSVITLANGELQGYLVTQDAIRRGRYEAGNALFQSPDSGERLLDATDSLLASLCQTSGSAAP